MGTDWLLDIVLRRIIKRGALIVESAGGRTFRYGDGTGTPVAIAFTSRSWQRAVVLDPELQVGQAYTDGGLVVREGSIAEFLHIVFQNLNARRPQSAWTRFFKRTRRVYRYIFHFNNVFRSKKNAQHHYNISHDIYKLFLDSEMQYSCAYFKTEKSTLEEAQQAKIRLIARKLLIDKKNLRVLDIGCGWGKLAIHLAQHHRADVVGINVSNEQLKIADANLVDAQRNASEPLRCEFRFADYRNLPEDLPADQKFDRIVSVGMFEHVGKSYYETFFRKCFNLLSDDGVMLLHTIGRDNGPREPNAWVWKYIFPGGYAPDWSEVAPVISRSGFRIAHVEALHKHYEYTSRHWRTRFMSHEPDVRKIMGDRADHFIKMWEFYLAGFEANFKHSGLVAFQFQLAKNVDVLPWTQKYIHDDEMSYLEEPTFDAKRLRIIKS